MQKKHLVLSPEEEEVLKLGLNFAPTPKRVPTIDILAGIESSVRRAKLPNEASEELRARVCSFLKNSAVKDNNLKPSLGHVIIKKE